VQTDRWDSLESSAATAVCLVFGGGPAQPLEAAEIATRQVPADRHTIAAAIGSHSHSCHGDPAPLIASNQHQRVVGSTESR
jgi:hypothetical protein